MSSAGQNTISQGSLDGLPVPLAPANEQRRIVAKIEELFSDLDAGMAALERVRANLKRYRAAVLKAAVEGRLTAEWRVDAASRRVSNGTENRDVRPAESNEAESGDGNAAGRRVYDEPPGHGWFDPTEPVADLAGNLPHWRQEAVTYFVTFRLADSLPQAKLRQWLAERDAWLAAHPKPWDEATRQVYHRQFTARLEKWLDAGYGSCLLEREDVRATVASALLHFDGDRYWLDDWVVMPNHVHVLLTPQPGYELSQILHSWKSFTSHEVRRLVSGWQGSLWQKESFDHIVRSPDHLERFRAYIARNPAGLDAARYTRSVDAASRRSRVEAEGRRRAADGADRVACLRGDVDEDGITRRDDVDEEGITRRDAASTNENGPELLTRILAERRRRWEQEQLAAFAKAGKIPPAKWKEKYKEPAGPDCTKLPALPEGWCWASVEQLLAEPSCNGISVKGSNDPPGIPALRLSAMGELQFDYTERRYIPISEDTANALAIQAGDFFVARGNGSLHLVGRGTLAQEPGERIVFPDTMIRLRFASAAILRQFIARIWSSRLLRGQIERKARTTAGIYKISQRDIDAFAIPLPPIDEQSQVIAEVEHRLSVIDVSQASLEANVKRSDRLRQAILRRAFEGKLVPQGPSDEPADKLLERIKANRTRLAERGDGKHKRRDAASTVDAASRRVTKDGGRASR